MLVELFWDKRYHLNDLTWESAPLALNPCDDWKCCICSVTLKKGASHFFFMRHMKSGPYWSHVFQFEGCVWNILDILHPRSSKAVFQALSALPSGRPAFQLCSWLLNLQMGTVHSCFKKKSCLILPLSTMTTIFSFFKRYKGRKDIFFSLFSKTSILKQVALSNLVFKL